MGDQLEEAVQVTRFLRKVYLDQGRVIKTVTAQPHVFLTGAQGPYETICREFFRLGIKEHIVRVLATPFCAFVSQTTCQGALFFSCIGQMVCRVFGMPPCAWVRCRAGHAGYLLVPRLLCIVG